jgi:hypothetical protein
MKPKNSIAALTWALGALLASPAFGDGYLVGKVEFVRIHDGAVIGGWGLPIFWFTLIGVANHPTCPGWVSGRTIFTTQGKEALAFVLSAQLAGKEIAVLYSDQALLNGFCRAAAITTGDPPPAF